MQDHGKRGWQNAGNGQRCKALAGFADGVWRSATMKLVTFPPRYSSRSRVLMEVAKQRPRSSGSQANREDGENGSRYWRVAGWPRKRSQGGGRVGRGGTGVG